MHINVEGIGIVRAKPNEIILNLDFISKKLTFEEAFNEGTSSVKEFIDSVLIPNGYKKEDLITKSFRITNVDEYNPTSNKMEFSHYLYKQEGEFKFDYDINKLALILTNISSLKKPPLLKVNFTNNDTEEHKKEALKLAYNNALERASVLAQAANKVIKETIKIDYKPQISPLLSPTQFDQGIMTFKSPSADTVSTVKNIFTPSDVEIKENIFVLFQAE